MATDKYGYRDYLKSQGHKDEDIGYSNGAVTLKGKVYDYVTPDQDGRARADLSRLKQRDSIYGYGQERDAYKGKADDYTTKRDSYIDQYAERLGKPADKFNFNPETSQIYQSYMNQAQTDVGRMAGNVAADMNKRGILNSTVTADRTAQEGGRIISDARNQAMPLAINQAYKQYMDEQAMFDKQSQGMLDLADTYNSLEGDSFERYAGFDTAVNQGEQYLTDYANKQAAAESKAQSDAEQKTYDRAWDIADATGKLPKYITDMYGLPAGITTIEAEKLGISRMNAETSRMNASTSAGQLSLSQQREKRIAAGGGSSGGSTSYKKDAGFQADYSYAIQNPVDAMADFEANPSEWIELYGIDGFNDLVSATSKKIKAAEDKKRDEEE